MLLKWPRAVVIVTCWLHAACCGLVHLQAGTDTKAGCDSDLPDTVMSDVRGQQACRVTAESTYQSVTPHVTVSKAGLHSCMCFIVSPACTVLPQFMLVKDLVVGKAELASMLVISPLTPVFNWCIMLSRQMLSSVHTVVLETPSPHLQALCTLQCIEDSAFPLALGC